MPNNVDFWQVHGILFVVSMFFFPRLTMLFATPISGFLWWTGWIFAPRITVAILATYYYFQTNPVLCVLTWIWALMGEGAEKSRAANIVMKKETN